MVVSMRRTDECFRLRQDNTILTRAQLYDDFTEKRPGAARELEASLNRPRMHGNGGTTPVSPARSQDTRASSTLATLSTQTSWSSYGAYNTGSPVGTK
jgi:hypothetical protein